MKPKKRKTTHGSNRYAFPTDAWLESIFQKLREDLIACGVSPAPAKKTKRKRKG